MPAHFPNWIEAIRYYVRFHVVSLPYSSGWHLYWSYAPQSTKKLLPAVEEVFRFAYFTAISIDIMEKMSTCSRKELREASFAALRVFISEAHVGRLSKTLRNLILSHIRLELDTPSAELEDEITDLQALFDFLDVLEMESGSAACALTGSSFP